MDTRFGDWGKGWLSAKSPRNTSNNERQKKALVACCGAHIIQDGLVALQFVLLPILAQLFNLNYTQVGILRAVSSTAAAVLEIPAGVLAEKWRERRLIAIGLACAGLGYIGVAYSFGYLSLLLCLAVAGAGAGFQHSLSSSVIVNSTTGNERRRALGIYNSSGDAGKLAYTGIFSVGIGAGIAWDVLVVGLSIVAIVFGLLVWRYLLSAGAEQDKKEESATQSSVKQGWGIKNPREYTLLGVIIFLDSGVQTTFLTFLAFVLIDKGADQGIAAMAVVIALIGGMIGKFVSGYLAAKFGDRATFIVLEVFTVIGMVLMVFANATTLLFLLPFIGLALQGTSTVTYGSVAQFVDSSKQSRGYAVIYSLATVSSVFGPLLIGYLGDVAGLDSAMWALALTALLPIGLSYVLTSVRAL